MKPAEISASLPIVADLGAGRQLARDAVGRPEMRDAAVRHGDDGVGLVDHRLVEAVAERIAGEGEHRPRTAVGREGGCRHRDERSH